MLERLEKDYLASKIKATELDASARSKLQILDFEMLNQRKSKEDRLQSKVVFDSLMKNIELE